MPGTKTNERAGTRAVLRHYQMSAYKARQVLDVIRGQDVERARELLATVEREAAEVIGKVLASAVANAVHNDGQDADDLFVAACYADESTTMKRWRPRARGRATRIRKRTCHITVIVSRMDDERIARKRAQREALSAQRSRRVSESRRRADLSGRLSRRRSAAEQRAAEAEAAAEDEESEELGEDTVDDEVTDEATDVEETDEFEEGDEADEEASESEDEETTDDADESPADVEDEEKDG
jgi:large subunit ribosomal protein L22